jgi:hypothetical protein
VKNVQRAAILASAAAVAGVAVVANSAFGSHAPRAQGSPAARAASPTSTDRSLASGVLQKAVLLDLAGEDETVPTRLALAPQPSLAHVQAQSRARVKAQTQSAGVATPSADELVSARRTQVDKVFSGAAGKAEIAETESTIKADADPTFQNFGAGVKSLKITRLTVSGTQASAVADVVSWAAMAQKNPSGTWVAAVPSNTLVVNAQLDKGSDGQWKVASYTWTFAAGTGP